MHPVFNKGDTSRLCSLYDFAEKKYRALQALGVEEKNYSEVVTPMLLEKISDFIWLIIMLYLTESEKLSLVLKFGRYFSCEAAVK